MKKSLLPMCLFAISLFVTACGGGRSNFLAEGNFKGFNEGKLYIYGNDGKYALDTMSRIVDKGKFEPNGTVVLTTSEGYWDALTAAGIAGMTKAPVLMTEKKNLSSQTAEQLRKLTPKTIIVCGGEFYYCA